MNMRLGPTALRLLGLVVGLLAGVAFLIQAQQAFSGADLARLVKPAVVLGMLFGAAGYVLAVAVAGWSWQRLLEGMGWPLAWSAATWILAATQMAKYLPGNLGTPVARVALGLGQAISAKALVASLAMESLLATAVAAGLAGACLAFSPLGQGVLAQAWNQAALMLPAGGTLALAGIGAVLAGMAGYWGLRKLGARVQWVPRRQAMAAAVGGYVIHYAALVGGGLGLALIAFPEVIQSPGLLAGAILLGWVAGFLAPGLPAGLGVREALMAFLLQLACPPADALLFILAFRLATMAGDALLAALAFSTRKLFGARATRQVAPDDLSSPPAKASHPLDNAPHEP